MRVTGTILSLLVLLSVPLGAQETDRPVQWERSEEAPPPPVTVFRSTQGINFPTTTTLGRGEWQFEISHRFVPPIADWRDTFFGLDGPVQLRLGLGYAVADWAVVTLQRSNLQDNLDLNVRGRLFTHRSDRFPFQVGAQLGVAYNDELPEISPTPEPWQFYAMVMFNQRLGSNFALGIVPAYVRNPEPTDSSPGDAFSVGLNGQWYLSDSWSLLGEWNFSEPWGDRIHDGGAFGVELETGGHFFKVVVTNVTSANPSQFLTGTEYPLAWNQLRLGFNITRVLSF